MRKGLLILCATATALALGTPAYAASSSSTTVTFTVNTSTLDITAPASVDLGAADPGGELVVPMGVVFVNDQRAALIALWTASVTSTSFTTGGGTPAETILRNFVNYYSGPETAHTGDGTFVPGQPTHFEEVTLDQTRTAFSKTAGAGNNTLSFNPHLSIHVPPTQVAGVYTGTVTHSITGA